MYIYACTDLSEGKALLNPFIMELETVKRFPLNRNGTFLATVLN